MKELLNLLFHFKFKELFYERTDNALVQFFRSVFVGGIATVADFVVTALVRELVLSGDGSLENLIANSSGFIVGLAVNFALSCWFVFSRSKYGRAKEFVAFAAIGVVGLGINNLIVFLLGICGMNAGWLFYIAKVVATLLTLIWNFSARRFFIYRPENAANTNEEVAE